MLVYHEKITKGHAKLTVTVQKHYVIYGHAENQTEGKETQLTGP